MPKDFENCVDRGGRVRTVKPKGSQSSTYLHVCYDKAGSHSGEVKHAGNGFFDFQGSDIDPFAHFKVPVQDRNHP